MSHPAWVCGLKQQDVLSCLYHIVTPCVGVWIETMFDLVLESCSQRSHPAWVCGLKLCKYTFISHSGKSHPAWVCGLKHTLNNVILLDEVTPCVGVWIETPQHIPVGFEYMSHPAWVCGLKPIPFHNIRFLSSHTLRGCVD